ncbi:hypothetical protein BJX63DRAFT_199221 [Aspergillus granulosus]|uniref:Nephrocystin 3-like N-terminal domain-containing protein n=1 Tax=Aspergillus granulosus TaxID=176169 RepID=A0ABR4HG39_9EURO
MPGPSLVGRHLRTSATWGNDMLNTSTTFISALGQNNNTGNGNHFSNNIFTGTVIINQNDDLRRRQNDILQKLHVVQYEDEIPQHDDQLSTIRETVRRHPTYECWQDSESPRVLWVEYFGSGGSALSRCLVDLLQTPGAPRDTGYFIFKSGTRTHPKGLNNITTALCCILHRLFDRNRELLTSTVADKFESRNWITDSFSQLWDILVDVARQNKSREIICILDAVDECEVQGWTKFAIALRNLHSNQDQLIANLKFVVTSRGKYRSQSLGIQDPHIIRLYSGHNIGIIEEIVEEATATAQITSETGVRDNSHSRGLKMLRQRRFAKAQAFFQEAITEREESFGLIHPDTCSTFHFLARSHQAQGNHKTAEKNFRTAYERSKQRCGYENPVTLRHMRYLAGAILYQGKYREAKKIFKYVAKVQERTSGRISQRTLYSLDQLGQCQLAHGELRYGRGRIHQSMFSHKSLQDAEQTFRDIYQRRAQSAENAGTWPIVESLLWLSQSLFALGKYGNAQNYLEKALKLGEGLLKQGLHSGLFTETLYMLGLCLSEQKKYEDAVTMLRRCYQQQVEEFGDPSEDTDLTLRSIHICSQEQNRFGETDKAFWGAISASRGLCDLGAKTSMVRRGGFWVP